MKVRFALTLVWLASLVLAILICELLFYRSNPQGIRLLLAEDRPEVYKNLTIIYGPLSLVLLAWFVKPVKKQQTNFQRALPKLAIITTVIFNLVILYLLIAGLHFANGSSMASAFEIIRSVGISLSFLYAPINAFYFGIRNASQ